MEFSLYASIAITALCVLICFFCTAVWMRLHFSNAPNKQLVRSYIYDNFFIGLLMLSLLWRRLYILASNDWVVEGSLSTTGALYNLGIALFFLNLCINNLWRAARTLHLPKIKSLTG